MYIRFANHKKKTTKEGSILQDKIVNSVVTAREKVIRWEKMADTWFCCSLMILKFQTDEFVDAVLSDSVSLEITCPLYMF